MSRRRRLPLIGLIVVAVAGALIAVAVKQAEAKPRCQTHRCEVRVARKQCDAGRYKSCIRRAALHHGVSYSDMSALAWCESTHNRFAQNGPYLGPYQFDARTFAATGYADRGDRTSWKWSSLAAAKWIRLGYRRSAWPNC